MLKKNLVCRLQCIIKKNIACIKKSRLFDLMILCFKNGNCHESQNDLEVGKERLEMCNNEFLEHFHRGH